MSSKSFVFDRSLVPAWVLSATVLAAIGAPSWADVLAEWDLADQPGNQLVTLGLGIPGAAASDLARGPGLNVSGGSGSMSSSGWADDPAGITATDPDFFEFGLDLAPGYQVELDELFIGSKSSNTGPGTLGLYSSADGYSSPLYQFVQPGSDWLYSRVDLSGLGPLQGDLTIRLVEIGNSQADGVGATTSGGTFRLGGYSDGDASSPLQVTGSISPVPEPGTNALLALGGAVLLASARKRE